MQSGIDTIVAMTNLVAQCEMDVWIIQRIDEGAAVQLQNDQEKDRQNDSDRRESDRRDKYAALICAEFQEDSSRLASPNTRRHARLRAELHTTRGARSNQVVIMFRFLPPLDSGEAINGSD